MLGQQLRPQSLADRDTRPRKRLADRSELDRPQPGKAVGGWRARPTVETFATDLRAFQTVILDPGRDSQITVPNQVRP